VPKQDFVASYRHYWLAERGLQLAAETVFDIGSHILAGHFNVHPNTYEDVLEHLARQGVLTPDVRESLRGLGGFRNILVHEYLDIEEERVYQALQEETASFDAFADEIEAFLVDLGST
jgi:uncharacterized protein YutE (UPF0331/DUF86 family)